MSFSQQTKAELCSPRVERRCCALAEAYGVLLYCRSFTPQEICISTVCRPFAERLPHLFRRAFGLGFDTLPGKDAERFSFKITDKSKIKLIYDSLGCDTGTLSLHINLGMLEEPCCRASFVRGAFLAGGSVTDPEKRYHMELATSHYSVSREAYSVLRDLGFLPGEAERRGNHLLYFKKSEAIEDLLTTIGAPVAAMNLMAAKVDRSMKNSINRKVNCDSANADKLVAAAAEQLEAIKRIDRLYGLETLPDKLQETALLRFANPEASLTELAMLACPPVSKSCLNHRLRKLLSYKPDEV